MNAKLNAIRVLMEQDKWVEAQKAFIGLVKCTDEIFAKFIMKHDEDTKADFAMLGFYTRR
jgi:hypothetical protein